MHYLDPMSDDVTQDWLGEPSDSPKPHPLRAVRSHGKPPLPKRFYKEAGFAEGPDGFRLTLDGRSANTPARNPLAVPPRGRPEFLAAEGGARGASIDPAQMPVTRLVNTAIDGVAPRREAVIEDL